MVGSAGAPDVTAVAARALLRAVPECGQVGIWSSPKPACFSRPRYGKAFGLQYSAFVMLSRRILFCSVVRFSPRRSAADPGPEICPDAAFNAPMIACLSASWNVDTEEAYRTDDFLSSVSGTFNCSP